MGEEEGLVKLLGAAEGVDEDGVEELIGEAEVVALEPGDEGGGGVEGGGGGGEGFQEGVPEWGGDRPVGLGEAELGGVEAGWGLGLGLGGGGGEELEEWGEVVVAVFEGGEGR